MALTERRIVVVGMGYVGIPCAALLADVPGFVVTGIQRRSKRSGWKIDCLNAGKNPFEGHEPGLADLIARVVAKGTFHVTDDFSACRDADSILIDVQTPVEADCRPRYDSLRDVCQQVGAYLRPGTLVIVESTVAPGTTQGVVQPILEQTSGLRAGPDFFLAFSYERVMPGKLLEYIVDFPRVVGGIDDLSTERAVALYGHVVRAEITPTDCLTAEVAKVVENAYRDVNIAFANEVALACEVVGVDVYRVRALINARPDRHMHIPGAGVGGHCLPKDSWLLVHGVETLGRGAGEPVRPPVRPWRTGRTDGQGSGGACPSDRRAGEKEGQGDGETPGGEDSSSTLHSPSSILRLTELAREINHGMPAHVAELTRQALAETGSDLPGARIAVLGVAYLEDADDTRNAPTVPLVDALLAAGARVIAHDPYVRAEDVEWTETQARWRATYGQDVPLMRDLEAALEAADAAVLVTRHGEYRDPDWAEVAGWMRGRAVVDGRNFWDPAACRAAGFAYRGVGKGR